jgi:hypothetical protein
MRWHVRNNGSSSWDSDSADYRYVNGDRLHVNSIYDFNNTVAPGSSVDIVVDMVTPGQAGTYTTRWRITIGNNEFCTMEVTIIVK